MNKITTIIFDLGGVLIDWNPEHLYKKVIPDPEKRNYFLANICTTEWNAEQDGGRPIREANALLTSQFPSYKKEIEAYYGRWEEMLGGVIRETESILNSLHTEKKARLFALTNWSAETFPIAYERYAFFKNFEGIVVSGEEKTRKPFREIYQLIADRYRLNPQECFFIDDNLENIQGARDFGFLAHQFQTPQQLKVELKNLGFLS